MKILVVYIQQMEKKTQWEYFKNIFIYGPKIYASFMRLERHEAE